MTIQGAYGPRPLGDNMRLTCPSCGGLGEIVSFSDADVAYYCRECGIIKDLAIVTGKAKTIPTNSRAWASTPEGLSSLKNMRD